MKGQPNNYQTEARGSGSSWIRPQDTAGSNQDLMFCFPASLSLSSSSSSDHSIIRSFDDLIIRSFHVILFISWHSSLHMLTSSASAFRIRPHMEQRLCTCIYSYYMCICVCTHSDIHTPKPIQVHGRL